MSISSLVSVSLAALTALGLTLSSPRSAAAQSSVPEAGRWELRIPSGAFVPTGDLRSTVKDAQVTGVQLSYLVRPQIAVTGSFAWARSRDLASVQSPKLDVFTSDLGLEVRSAERLTEGPVSVRAFAGFGVGVRSYNYRTLDVDATNNVAGYAGIGGELGMGRVGLRLEVRDYATGFKPLVGVGGSETRNDLVLLAALRFNRKPAARAQE